MRRPVWYDRYAQTCVENCGINLPNFTASYPKRPRSQKCAVRRTFNLENKNVGKWDYLLCLLVRVCLCVPHLKFWPIWPTVMKSGMKITPLEYIPTSHCSVVIIIHFSSLLLMRWCNSLMANHRNIRKIRKWQTTSNIYKRGKSNPCTGLFRPGGFQQFEAPRF